MEERDDDVPLIKGKYVVGIVYNLKKGIKSKAVDDEAEYDSIDTVNAIKKALESDRIEVVLLEADNGIFSKLLSTPVDIVFNIAEGIMGRGREAQVPALMNMLKIPFTGSDETTLCLALDKALTKRLLTTYHIKTPHYLLVKADDFHVPNKLSYPLIVKPNAEGSSKGVSDTSIVESYQELVELISRNNALYHSDMLVEEYIHGREFTVGILGNKDEVHVFAPMEIVYHRNTQGNYRVYSYGVKQDYKSYVTYECPSKIDKRVEEKMIADARRIYDILGCRDFARVDFRVSADNEVYFIEINPLPGLAPSYSDYPMLAAFCGMDYQTLVKNILKSGAKRYNLQLLSEDQ
ncbi:D-alanine--D-alanine ligase A [bioreactor metagenome]|uniref:D-alanine--D-alanine ligase A n=1 Tax=bioreactor metagenome TaxID=1076179 RepID=A0A644ZR78_9ZZZZ